MALRKGFFESDEFETALKRRGVWPVTVWEVADNNPVQRQLKKKMQDRGQTRTVPGSTHGMKSWWTNSQGATTSIFPPQIALNILGLYGPRSGTVYDPFAGGGCRAVMAAKAGLHYTGVEIRFDEVVAIRNLARTHNVSSKINIVHGDACNPGLDGKQFDFCFTCPPYWNMERYDGGPNDLSMITKYDRFLAELDKAIRHTYRLLKPGSVSCWVVGLHRHADGELAALNHDIARLHRAAGFWFKEEVIIYRKNPMTALRAGTFEKGHHLLVRNHEYCLVFERR